MRLWTLHPRYLDAKGLVAAWREALLAQAVLRGRTLHAEATGRGYRFDRRRIAWRGRRSRLRATLGQLEIEWKHLRAKLAVRDRTRLSSLGVSRPQPHPLFRIVAGEVASWEAGGRRRRTRRRKPTKP
jgi:hypothetical protein